jgi:HAMP domain-containing protein
VSLHSLRSRFGLSVRRGVHAGEPSAHIFLQGIVRHSNGMLSVTPVCTSLAEMEGQIEQLKEELNEMLEQARRAFRERRDASGGP